MIAVYPVETSLAPGRGAEAGVSEGSALTCRKPRERGGSPREVPPSPAVRPQHASEGKAGSDVRA